MIDTDVEGLPLMRIIAKTHNVSALISMQKMAKIMGSPKILDEAHKGVIDAGRRTKTQVQRAAHQQMGMISYQTVSSNTRGSGNRGALAYQMWAVIGGQPVEKYKGLKGGTRQIPPGAAGTVSSGVWNRPRIFKRSFRDANNRPVAMLPGNRKTAPKSLWTYGSKPNQPRGAGGRFASTGRTYGKLRSLFGGSLRSEIGKDQALATFHRVGSEQLRIHVTKRVSKFMRI